ncbi:hypothetical protein J7J08_11915 [Stenotrophomonas sp. ISL-67]|uniref:hypothetical protein n=1 Tax=Stenotrophomonas sp. ISL-67 TaxID=2819171 RepID=UPI001BED2B97|nr:hypothetical protein [Stenotrophomonas sp. ISL-67]MBT2768345.1 hypothetical protein [Stenotrophomonas sp. ISL-67]
MREIECDGKLLVPKDIRVSVGSTYRMSQSVQLHARLSDHGHATTGRWHTAGSRLGCDPTASYLAAVDFVRQPSVGSHPYRPPITMIGATKA